LTNFVATLIMAQKLRISHVLNFRPNKTRTVMN